MAVAHCEEVLPLAVVHVRDYDAGVLVLFIEGGVVTFLASETVFEAKAALRVFLKFRLSLSDHTLVPISLRPLSHPTGGY